MLSDFSGTVGTNGGKRSSLHERRSV